MELLYTCSEISDLLGISIKSVYNKIATLRIKSVKYENGRSLYNYDHILQMKCNQRTPDIEKFYPLKTTEIFYIYESKLNSL
jgi:predicted DNA-binding protein YlxM (UPF0122 family)